MILNPFWLFCEPGEKRASDLVSIVAGNGATTKPEACQRAVALIAFCASCSPNQHDAELWITIENREPLVCGKNYQELARGR
jgi:hypothetical protein